MRNKQRSLNRSVRRRLEIEKILSQYPNLPSNKINEIVHWFKREATAMEVAVVASNLDVQDSYEQFRQAHIDKLTPVELAVTVFICMAVIVALAVGVAIS